MPNPMTTREREALIERILDHTDPDSMRDWASAWLEVLSDDELHEVRGYFVPTADPGLPHILTEDVAP